MDQSVLCSVDQCPKPRAACGLCHMHYWRLRNKGGVHVKETRQRKYPLTCTIEGCEKPSQAKGLCDMHYWRVRTHGTPEDRIKPPPKNGRRSIGGRHAATVIMEGIIGRRLTPDEVAHHRDENTLNDDPSNLQLMTKSTHNKLHRQQQTGNTDTHKRCPGCKEIKPRTEFGGQPRCRPCARIYERQYYAAKKARK